MQVLKQKTLKCRTGLKQKRFILRIIERDDHSIVFCVESRGFLDQDNNRAFTICTNKDKALELFDQEYSRIIRNERITSIY